MEYYSDSKRCCNCGQVHPSVPGRHSSNCVFIGAKTHGSGSDEELAAQRLSSRAYTTIPIPTSGYEQEVLFDQIWTWFIDIKEENDEQREYLLKTHSRKGLLKAKAPVVWLSWRSSDGRRGQTRNRDNYSSIWRRLIANPRSGKGNGQVAWLTLSPLNICPVRHEQTVTPDLDRSHPSKYASETIICS